MATVLLVHHRAGPRGEPPLVLLHGIGSRWQMWAPVLPALTATRDVIALDLPGFGESPMPADPGTPPSVDALCALVLAFLAELGVTRFDVAGNSLGGLMALELARRGAATSVCAISPAGFANRAETAAARATLRASVRLARRLAPRADALMARPGTRRLMLSAFMAHPERVPPSVAAGDMRAMAGAPWFDAMLPAIEAWPSAFARPLGVPATIAWGDHDLLLLPRQAAHAAALIPDARMVTLTGCGHIPTWDDPDQVTRALLAA